MLYKYTVFSDERQLSAKSHWPTQIHRLPIGVHHFALSTEKVYAVDALDFSGLVWHRDDALLAQLDAILL